MAFWNRNNYNETQRQDIIYAVENEIAEQAICYTYNNEGFTVHTSDGDQSFDWQKSGGLQQTLNWLQSRASKK